MSEIFNLSIWSGEGRDLNTLRQNRQTIKTIIVDQGIEFQTGDYNGDSEGLKKIIEEFNDKKFIIISSTNNTHDKDIPNNYKIKDDIIEINFPGYWITKAVLEYKYTHLVDDTNNKNGIDYFDNNVNLVEPISSLFLSLNNVTRRHRCLTMDLLCKYNLLDKGNISWRDISHFNEDPDSELSSNSDNKYDFKYWTPKRLYLDQPLIKNGPSIQQARLPVQIKNSFMQLVPETTVDRIFISEKTATPLIFNKLFLSVAKENFHKSLIDLGFKLYDNVFDYSFDDEVDVEKRVTKLIENIKRYENYSFYDLKKIINQNVDVIKYNRQVALEYANKRIPQIILDINNELAENNMPALWLGLNKSYLSFVENKFYN